MAHPGTPRRHTRRPAAWARWAATLLALLFTVLACGAADVVIPATGWTWSRQAGPLALGVTHTQYSIDPSDPAPFQQEAQAILRDSAVYQNQHLMAFGTLNPEPSPGQYDWSSLDRRMALIRNTGGKAVLTLAVAPDWMKGGKAGETDYSEIETAPLREHFDDFAALSAAAVARYPQVDHVQVWNELKGFFDPERNTWAKEDYTDFYNTVYDAVKRVRPDVKVGGPYAVIDTWESSNAGGFPSDVSGPWGVVDQRSLDVVEYWLTHKRGADFVAIDGGTATKDGGLITDPRTASGFFATMDRWLRARTDLPIWWSEFYPDSRDAGQSSAPEVTASTLEAVEQYAVSGASTALLWGPRASKDFPYGALWAQQGDRAVTTPLTAAWTWLVPRLARGDVAIGHPPGNEVTAFQAADGALLVNTTDRAVTVSTADGSSVRLAAYGTAVVPLCAAATRPGDDPVPLERGLRCFGGRAVAPPA